eukprot:c24695_g1_i2 orf=91-714(+)
MEGEHHHQSLPSQAQAESISNTCCMQPQHHCLDLNAVGKLSVQESETYHVAGSPCLASELACIDDDGCSLLQPLSKKARMESIAGLAAEDLVAVAADGLQVKTGGEVQMGGKEMEVGDKRKQNVPIKSQNQEARLDDAQEEPGEKNDEDELDKNVASSVAEEQDAQRTKDEVKLGPKVFSSSFDMFNYFYKLLHGWPLNFNLNKVLF